MTILDLPEIGPRWHKWIRSACDDWTHGYDASEVDGYGRVSDCDQVAAGQLEKLEQPDDAEIFIPKKAHQYHILQRETAEEMD